MYSRLAEACWDANPFNRCVRSYCMWYEASNYEFKSYPGISIFMHTGNHCLESCRPTFEVITSQLSWMLEEHEDAVEVHLRRICR